MAPMSTHRHGVSVATLCGPMYAVGGHDGWSYLSSVERYIAQVLHIFDVYFLYCGSRMFPYYNHLPLYG